ncbi:hypothetical protein Tco_0534082 [Tanacetum coccineum]
MTCFIAAVDHVSRLELCPCGNLAVVIPFSVFVSWTFCASFELLCLLPSFLMGLLSSILPKLSLFFVRSIRSPELLACLSPPGKFHRNMIKELPDSNMNIAGFPESARSFVVDSDDRESKRLLLEKLFWRLASFPSGRFIIVATASAHRNGGAVRQMFMSTYVRVSCP